MTLKRQLLTSKHNIIDIVSEDAKAQSHFDNTSNFADVVLTQINQDRFYDQIFDGEDNLTILDIGGNIGLFALYAHDRADMVYSVEPTPDHFHILKDLTKEYPNIRALDVALHNENTTIDFYISEENSTMNSSVNKYGKKVEVQAKTLRKLIDDLGLTHVDFIKCDIEGSEVAALTFETISEVKDMVDCWFIEVHATDKTIPWEQSLEKNRRSIANIFEQCGYEVQDYRHDGLYVAKSE